VSIISIIYAYNYSQTAKWNSIEVDINISTIGDSLTDSGHYDEIMNGGNKEQGWYQYYMYQYLKVLNIESRIHNYGIGGQSVQQITGRFNVTVPADYITCMAGTNDLWWVDINYTNSNVGDIKAQHIIQMYNQTIFNTMQNQTAKGFSSPTIIICSIPPPGNTTSLPEKMAATVVYVNTRIAQFISNLNRTDVLFCDVHKAMRADSNYAIDGLLTSDGIHFEAKGKQVCGEAIAQIIANHFYAKL